MEAKMKYSIEYTTTFIDCGSDTEEEISERMNELAAQGYVHYQTHQFNRDSLILFFSRTVETSNGVLE